MVKIYLAPKVRIPKRLRQLSGCNVELEKRAGISVRRLQIPRAKATFFPGGGVQVILGQRYLWGFRPLHVLEIRDRRGKLLERNYYLCTKCYTLTGLVTEHSPSPITGRYDAKVVCQSCDSEWEVRL